MSPPNVPHPAPLSAALAWGGVGWEGIHYGYISDRHQSHLPSWLSQAPGSSESPPGSIAELRRKQIRRNKQNRNKWLHCEPSCQCEIIHRLEQILKHMEDKKECGHLNQAHASFPINQHMTLLCAIEDMLLEDER